MFNKNVVKDFLRAKYRGPWLNSIIWINKHGGFYLPIKTSSVFCFRHETMLKNFSHKQQWLAGTSLSSNTLVWTITKYFKLKRQSFSPVKQMLKSIQHKIQSPSQITQLMYASTYGKQYQTFKLPSQNTIHKHTSCLSTFSFD